MHRLAHLLKWNLGRVISALDEHGNVWVAFRCDKCGAIDGRRVAALLQESSDE